MKDVSKPVKKGDRIIRGIICSFVCLILFIIVFHTGIALFGNWFKADETVLKDTAIAQKKLNDALFFVFGDYGKLEICRDYSVRAYISRENYMNVGYPDRELAITTVGKAWCENNGLYVFRLNWTNFSYLSLRIPGGPGPCFSW